ncbi:hypothetical protein Ocin01_04779 [Orchesella cincta]|uniref:WAP domain-containing protein n=1 Tax=Orchesella cincta TaxID=48709 RepID=A0A1D2N9G2_ORCCI|nr:hypothetical protein Ocin01_04779 [Orchesella cincta]
MYDKSFNFVQNIFVCDLAPKKNLQSRIHKVQVIHTTMNRTTAAVAGVVVLLCLFTVSDSFTFSTAPRTCGAPITSSSKFGFCGVHISLFCLSCVDECKRDIDCPGPNRKCCPSRGCGNVCQGGDRSPSILSRTQFTSPRTETATEVKAINSITMSRTIAVVAGVVVLLCLFTVSDSFSFSTVPRTCAAPITSTNTFSRCGTHITYFCLKCSDECKADRDCGLFGKCCPNRGCGNVCNNDRNRN